MTTTTPALFHSLLRPCVLQILRAQGYHSTRTTVIDSLTEMAARYLSALCESTARHAAHNGSDGGVPGVLDIRMALQECGAILPEVVFEEQMWADEEDTRGMDEFVGWTGTSRYKEIKRIALDGDEENTDYLSALQKRHSKSGEDSKYNGTVLGKGNDHGEVIVEGAEFTSIRAWQENRNMSRSPEPNSQPHSPTPGGSREPSSGLSSLGDLPDEMDLS